MTHEYTSPIYETRAKEARRKNRKEHLYIPAISIISIGATALASSYAIERNNERTPVEQVTVGIDSSAITTVGNAAEILAQQADIDPASISGIFEAGTEVNAEIKHEDGREAQPGRQVVVTLEKNGFGQYSVSADPTHTIER